MAERSSPITGSIEGPLPGQGIRRAPGKGPTDEQRRRAQYKDADARADNNSAREGLRIQLTKLQGVTKGDAAKALAMPFRFQCPPLEEFSIARQRQFGRWSNYKGTEYAERGGKPLQPITFRTLAVEWGSFTVERYWDVPRIVQRLDDIYNAGWPIDLLAFHPYNDKPEIHMRVLLEGFTSSENAGEADARYMDLSFIQWRPPTVQRKALGRAPGGNGADWPIRGTLLKTGVFKATIGKKKVDVSNASLAKIAKAVYGRATMADEIAKAQKPPIKTFGKHTALTTHPAYKKGGTLLLPEMQLVASKGRGTASVPDSVF